jgi:CPA2 family monovalent cation:H+ antiporter-2
LQREATPFLLIEDAEDRVLAARERGIEVIVGNAAGGEALRLANVMGARCVVIGIPNAFEAGQATEQCRKLNPEVKIIARAHSEEEVDYLVRLGADEVIMGEREIGLGMIDWLRGEERTTMKREGAGLRFADAENILESVRGGSGAAEPAPAEPAAAEETATVAEAPGPTATAAPEEPVMPKVPEPEAAAAEPRPVPPDAPAARVVPASAITLLLPDGEEVPSDDGPVPEGAEEAPPSLEPQLFPETPAAANADASASPTEPAANDEAPPEADNDPDPARDTREKVESES